MQALRKYIGILAGERSTLVGAIMVAGSLVGWEISAETADHVEQLLLGLVNVVGVVNMLLPDHVGKIRG